jgi:hypothetical protein
MSNVRNKINPTVELQYLVYLFLWPAQPKRPEISGFMIIPEIGAEKLLNSKASFGERNCMSSEVIAPRGA